MRILVLAAVLFIVGCAGQSAVQTMSQVCGVYSSTIVSLSAFKSDMSAAQIAIVDQSIALLSPTCEGVIPTGDAGDLALSSLDNLEALLIQLRKN